MYISANSPSTFVPTCNTFFLSWRSSSIDGRATEVELCANTRCKIPEKKQKVQSVLFETTASSCGRISRIPTTSPHPPAISPSISPCSFSSCHSIHSDVLWASISPGFFFCPIYKNTKHSIMIVVHSRLQELVSCSEELRVPITAADIREPQVIKDRGVAFAFFYNNSARLPSFPFFSSSHFFFVNSKALSEVAPMRMVPVLSDCAPSSIRSPWVQDNEYIT